MYKFLGGHKFSFLLDKIPRSGITESYGNYMLNFKRETINLKLL